MARSLGALGVRIFWITHDSPLAGWSKYVERSIRWPGPHEPDAAGRLLEIGRTHALQGWLLIPAADAVVRLAAEQHHSLSAVYRLILPGWDVLKFVCDKPLLYEHAAKLGIDVPKTWHITVPEERPKDMSFPVVLKPHMGGGRDPFTMAKAIKAENCAAFVSAFRRAASQIGAGRVVVQELVPGGGENQFSYAALWKDGRPVAEFTARRTRQYPVEFGYTSTFVEIVDEPRAVDAARRLLLSIGHEGLVEVEFKQDHRDGMLKLLDVNPRPWSWMGLAAAAGVDLGATLWALAEGRPSPQPIPRAKPGTAWVYLSRDAAGAGQLIATGRLGFSAYLRSLSAVRTSAVFSTRDPLPGLIDLPLTAWRVLTRRLIGATRFQGERSLSE